MSKILVVEDEESLREDILEILRFDNFEVYGAENGITGVEKAREIHPDLIICDIMMPERDGYGVLLELRSDPSTAMIPLIFLTARASREDQRRGMELGADDYLTKPFTQPELLAAISTRLEKQAMVRREYEKRFDDLRMNIIHALPHELRTPLTGIFGYARMLMDDCEIIDPGQIYQMSYGIDRAAKRLHRVAENYLLYAQIELIAQQDNPTLRDDVTGFPAMTFENTARQKLHEAERYEDMVIELVDHPIRFPEDSLERIIIELLDNAIKFSDPGTKICVTTTVEDDHLVLSVMDHGRGMTAEQIDMIGAYMQFQRRLFEQNGLGLGLIIVKRLVEMQGGTFHIESEVDRYTKVQVGFPLAD